MDKVPSIQIDLDFLDTGGFVILPIATAQIPIDATPILGEPRPTENLKIVQIVDEREADQGILKVEVKATSNGLVPELDQLLKPSLDNFLRTELSGGEISISKLDAESKKGSPISERNWILTFTKSENESAGPDLNFSFPEPIIETEEILFQRYDDADLVSSSQTIKLEQRYDKKNSKWFVWVLLIFFLLLTIVFKFRRKTSSSSKQTETVSDFYVPHEITPFSVLGLLRKIHNEKDFAQDIQNQLIESIASVEKVYFDKENQKSLNLKDIAEEWVNKAV